MNDDEWVERLRRAVAEGGTTVEERDDHPPIHLAEVPPSEPPEPPAVDVAALTSTLEALEQTMRQLDGKLASVDGRLRLLEHQRERIVDQIADAVVVRLEATPERGWRSTAGRWLSS